MNNFIILGQSPRHLFAKSTFNVEVIDLSRESVFLEGVHMATKDAFEPVIKRNRIKCESCGEILESIYTHHWTRCRCKLCAIDGGKTQLIRKGVHGMYLEMSEFIIPHGLKVDEASLISKFTKF